MRISLSLVLFITFVVGALSGAVYYKTFEVEAKQTIDNSGLWEDMGGNTSRRAIENGWLYYADGGLTFVPVPEATR